MSMKIDRNNYEAWLVDYLDGQLTAEQVAELTLFLELNPDLKEDFDLLGEASLTPNPEIGFQAKDSLKKEIVPAFGIDEDNYEDWMIREVEGQLSAIELEQLQSFIDQNPGLAHDRELFRNTILEANLEEVHPDKTELQHPQVVTGLVHAHNVEDFLIRELEGDLNPEEQAALDGFLAQNPEGMKMRAIYAQTVLQPQADIVYADKGDLRKPVVIPLFSNRTVWLSAAASVIVLLMAWYLFPSNVTEQQYQPIASTGGVEVPEWQGQQMPVTLVADQKTPATTADETPDDQVVEQILPSYLPENNPEVSFAVEEKVKPSPQKEDDVIQLIQKPSPKFNFPDPSRDNELKNYANEVAYAAAPKKNVVARPAPKQDDYLTVKQFFVKKTKKFLNVDDSSAPADGFTGTEVMQATANGFNKITGSKLEVNKEVDNSGRVAAVNLKAGKFSLRKKVGKK